MKVKGITDECFTDYKLPAMFIAVNSCSFKCDRENGCQLCQNMALAREPDIEVSKETLIERFMLNPITKAIVFGGLEPFDNPVDLTSFVDCARRQYHCMAPIVIYTGYTEEEIIEGKFKEDNVALKTLVDFILAQPNIVIKYGRFRPNQEPHYDEVLGVKLASDNQYAKQYNFEEEK